MTEKRTLKGEIKGTPFLRFPVSSEEEYIERNGITCVRSGPIRYHDCCFEQPGGLKYYGCDLQLHSCYAMSYCHYE